MTQAEDNAHFNRRVPFTFAQSVARNPSRLIHRQHMGYISIGLGLSPIDVSEEISGLLRDALLPYGTACQVQ
jgi:hypothetical protein